MVQREAAPLLIDDEVNDHGRIMDQGERDLSSAATDDMELCDGYVSFSLRFCYGNRCMIMKTWGILDSDQ